MACWERAIISVYMFKDTVKEYFQGPSTNFTAPLKMATGNVFPALDHFCGYVCVGKELLFLHIFKGTVLEYFTIVEGLEFRNTDPLK